MRSNDAARRRKGLSAVPVLGDFVALTRLARDAKQPAWLKLLVVLALVYVVSPIDAMPELVAPMIAWLDDVGLLLALRLVLARRLDPYRYPLFGSPPPALLEAESGVPAIDGESLPHGAAERAMG